MKFALILIIWNATLSGEHTSSQSVVYFDNRLLCEAAASAAKSKLNVLYYEAVTLCVPTEVKP
ncbi:MAG: hypothetical protein EBR82_44145 [Caulobacteraceae bacterium]|nr:hypothetical protein [Caulobacteraceae bacterium]